MPSDFALYDWKEENLLKELEYINKPPPFSRSARMQKIGRACKKTNPSAINSPFRRFCNRSYSLLLPALYEENITADGEKNISILRVPLL